MPPDLNASPFLTTAEAAAYLRFKTTSGVRMAVRRGELRPAGRGPRGVFLFTIPELDRFVAARGARYSSGDREAPGKDSRGKESWRKDEVSGCVPDEGWTMENSGIGQGSRSTGRAGSNAPERSSSRPGTAHFGAGGGGRRSRCAVVG